MPSVLNPISSSTESAVTEMTVPIRPCLPPSSFLRAPVCSYCESKPPKASLVSGLGSDSGRLGLDMRRNSLFKLNLIDILLDLGGACFSPRKQRPSTDNPWQDCPSYHQVLEIGDSWRHHRERIKAGLMTRKTEKRILELIDN